jgi:hypothetical protein
LLSGWIGEANDAVEADDDDSVSHSLDDRAKPDLLRASAPATLFSRSAFCLHPDQSIPMRRSYPASRQTPRVSLLRSRIVGVRGSYSPRRWSSRSRSMPGCPAMSGQGERPCTFSYDSPLTTEPRRGGPEDAFGRPRSGALQRLGRACRNRSCRPSQLCTHAARPTHSLAGGGIGAGPGGWW